MRKVRNFLIFPEIMAIFLAFTLHDDSHVSHTLIPFTDQSQLSLQLTEMPNPFTLKTVNLEFSCIL